MFGPGLFGCRINGGRHLRAAAAAAGRSARNAAEPGPIPGLPRSRVFLVPLTRCGNCVTRRHRRAPPRRHGSHGCKTQPRLFRNAGARARRQYRARGGGRAAGRHRSIARFGRAAARRRAWRHGDQCGDGSGQGRRQETARTGRCDRREIARRRFRAEGRSRRARLHQSDAEAAGLDRRLACGARRGRRIRPRRHRRGRQGECRIRLRQPDRPDACRPRPRRGVRRRARQSAGLCRL